VRVFQQDLARQRQSRKYELELELKSLAGIQPTARQARRAA
jgi:hypothetical protein